MTFGQNASSCDALTATDTEKYNLHIRNEI